MYILANDGIAGKGKEILEANGHTVVTEKIPQDELAEYINEHHVDVLLVRSATKVRAELIDACPSLKIIGRGGVGMDNIDVEYARNQGLYVINTPAASSHSVAELVFAHFMGMARFLHDSNRNMPLDGETRFKELKKNYAGGVELKGKTLGIIGFGRIGQETAKIGLGLGMRVIMHDPYVEGDIRVTLDFFDGQFVDFRFSSLSKEEVLAQSDFISLHVPAQNDYVIDAKAIELMKDGAFLVNAARGGVVDEVALVKALNDGKLSAAALDVFENEPKPEIALLMNPYLSLSPHIGAATLEAQERIGTELAKQILDIVREIE